MAGRVIALILVLALTAFLTACGGRSSSTATTITTATPTGTPAPSMEELEAKLWAELDRLGIDPERAVAAAPSGATNGVFDLAATVIDPDGAEELPPTGVELTWTERLLGDYNQDGQVNVSDLTPIGQYWDLTVSYDAASLHGGIPWWPAGDYGLDAGNWRRARVDGNANGLIEAADITTIGQHWMEVLTGYRVYRKAPGSDEFVRLANPASSASLLTIERPGDISQTGPVRYTFTDTPPGMGEYEYYVIGWSELTGHSSSEAETESNHVTATMSVSLTDTTPPVWDDTTGITVATDNTDGTVTVEWGTATDIAVPPAPATPPVTYTVYYSTETPIDFDNAGTVDGLDSTTWTSGKLVAGQEYHFAVRCRDSAADPNEDTNTNELSVTVTDPEPVEDTDPPVWTETYPLYNEFGDLLGEDTVTGIKKLVVGDGSITITCADAMDELNPPVHYDLYYISGREADSLYIDDPFGINPQAQVVEDIPKDYTLEWENRHLVHVGVRARDSADPPNVTSPTRYYKEFSVAPSNLKRIPLDMDIPMLAEYSSKLYEVHQTDYSYCFDTLTHTLYAFYTYSFWDDYLDNTQELWVLEIDMDTGNWESVQLGTWVPESDGRLDISVLGTACAPDETPWLLASTKNLGNSQSYFFHRTGPQQYSVWDPPDRQGGWSKDFSFNNYPAFYVSEKSEVNPDGQFKLYYRWWDEAAGEWHQEFVCDPAGVSPTSFLRPDGVVQLITYDDLSLGATEVPCYGHIHERQSDGTWTEVFRTDGKLLVNSRDMVYWDSEWAWTGYAWWGTPTNITDRDMLVYGMDTGYFWVEDLYTNEYGIEISGNWPAGSGYHIAPPYIFDGSDIVAKSWQHLEFSFNDPEITSPSKLIPTCLSNPICSDLATGWYATLKVRIDYASSTYQVYLWTAADGQSMYDLDN